MMRCIESRESVDEAKKTNVHVKHCANNARMRDGLKRKYDEQVLCAKVTNKCIRSTLRLSIDVVRMIQTQKSELKHRKWKKEKWNTHNNCGRLCVLFFITVRRIRTNVPFKSKRITCTLIIKCANYGALDWATMNHFSFSAWILQPRFSCTQKMWEDITRWIRCTELLVVLCSHCSAIKYSVIVFSFLLLNTFMHR